MYVNVNGNGTVTILATRDDVSICQQKRHKWNHKVNNRRTDIWFRYQGSRYHVVSYETATVYNAKKVKN
jgi:hypothetical protein